MPDSDTAAPRATARSKAKAERRTEILAAAARLMARRGFHSVRLEDIGAEVGISGPGMYRHFRNKEDVLAEMLLDISRRLEAGGAAVEERGGSPDEIQDGLIAVHVDFVVSEPDLVLVQFRDLGSLPPEPRHEVRALQRGYAERWVRVLCRRRPELETRLARARVHAVFGLLNSSPRLPALETPVLRELLTAMAQASLAA